MKKIMIAFCLMFSVSVLGAYDFADFSNDVMKDSKEVFGKEFSASYFLDFLEDGDSRHKIGISAPVLAYRFITLDPAFIYTPDSSNRIGEFGFAFPIRPGRIPIPGGRTVGSWVCERTNCGDKDSKDWIERMFVAPYMSHSLTTGRFGCGVNTGIKF